MSAQLQLEDHYVSETEYFALLDRSEEKLEWSGGEVRAMPDATRSHVTLMSRLATAINVRLQQNYPGEAVTSR